MVAQNLTLLPQLGLALAWLGAPLLLLVIRATRRDPLAWVTRLGFWALSATVCVIAYFSVEHWNLALGFAASNWRSIMRGALTAIATLIVWPVLGLIQRQFGAATTLQNPQFQKLAALPAGYRLFLVVTAAVTEEVLYRGYAIGVGGSLLGNTLNASALSIFIFTVSHSRWGLGHLSSVLWAALMLSALFVVTHDLIACILAHGAIDAVGLLLLPAMAKRGMAPVD